MKLYILSPNYKNLFTDEQREVLKNEFNAIALEDPLALSSIEELKTDGAKTLMLDPDFCDWNFSYSDFLEMKDLEAVFLQTTSIGWVDAKILESEIPVINSPSFSSPAVAEYMFMMTLALMRRLPETIRSDWAEDFSAGHLGMESRGRVAGILGMGNMARAVGKKCQANGMEVIYYSRSSRDENYKLVSKEELYSGSDVLFSCIPHTTDTSELMSASDLATLKQTSIVISPFHTLRNQDELVRLVDSKKIWGYGFEEAGGKTFANYKGNIMAVPAEAWATNETMLRCGEVLMNNVQSFSSGTIINNVNT